MADEKEKTMWDYLEEIDFKMVINLDTAIRIGQFTLWEVDP